MIKHIIFDFDGTIADSIDLSLDIILEYNEKFGTSKFTREELKDLSGYPIKERLKIMGVPLYKLPKLSLEFLEVYRSRIADVSAYENIRELTHKLKDAGYDLSIISSNLSENIKEFLNKNEIYDFDHIYSEKNLFGKDKPIKHLLKKLKMEAFEAIYIGDELRDIEACKKVPIKVISVTWGADQISLLKKGNPDYIAYKPMEIYEIIKGI